MNDSDFWKMCALLGIVCASIGASIGVFTYVMVGVVAEVIRPAIAAMVAA